MGRWCSVAAIGFAAGLVFTGRAQAQASVGDYSSWYTVVTAASKNHTDEVQQLLAQHRDPDAIDEQGRPALIWAVDYDNVAMTKMLLDSGAQVDLRDSFGNTALHWAAQRGNLALIGLLVAAHAEVDVQNRQGITPLMLAADASKIEAVRLLVADGADPKKLDYTGRDATSWAAGKPAVLQILTAKPHR